MKRIVIGGQLEKKRIESKIQALVGNQIILTVKSDMDAAQDMLAGRADYYIGACDTGGGGALAMAIAFLTIKKCKTVSSQAFKSSEEDIKRALDDGIVAFGMIPRDIDYILDILIPEILKK